MFSKVATCCQKLPIVAKTYQQSLKATNNSCSKRSLNDQDKMSPKSWAKTIRTKRLSSQSAIKVTAIVSFHSSILWSNYYDRTIIMMAP